MSLDLESISPAHGEKYSPNLYRFLRKLQGFRFIQWGVYSDTEGRLWLGWIDLDEFKGVRMMEALCQGSRACTMAYPLLAQELTEMPDFWARYQAVGRCAIDPTHEIAFMNDERRWAPNGNRRSCQWCGNCVQTLESYQVTRERWVGIAGAPCP